VERPVKCRKVVGPNPTWLHKPPALGPRRKGREAMIPQNEDVKEGYRLLVEAFDEGAQEYTVVPILRWLWNQGWTAGQKEMTKVQRAAR